MRKTILVLAANPKNTPRLRLDQEVREIDNGLRRAQNRDEFTLEQKWAVRPVDVRRAMLDYKPTIVHFCGHGSGEEGIAFEDENGQAKLVNADALANFFELFAHVECVVLIACYSDAQAEAIAKHIPYVIGMNKAIGDAAAIEFAVAFYDALGAGESVEFAYKLACNAIQWASMPESLTPVLKSKVPIEPLILSEKPQISFSLHLMPRLPCLLLLDVSGSMSGAPIQALTTGLKAFVADLKSYPMTLDRVELALITFGNYASILWDFVPVGEFRVPDLDASGSTATGEAIKLGLDLIERRKQEYKDQGIPHYQPIVLLFTDGTPTDDWLASVNRLHKESSLKKLRFITIGIDGADMEFLNRVSPPGTKPIRLNHLRFSEMFRWLSQSLHSVSRVEPKEEIKLNPPAEWLREQSGGNRNIIHARVSSSGKIELSFSGSAGWVDNESICIMFHLEPGLNKSVALQRIEEALRVSKIEWLALVNELWILRTDVLRSQVERLSNYRWLNGHPVVYPEISHQPELRGGTYQEQTVIAFDTSENPIK